MARPSYNPSDWYWAVAGNTAQVWSSKAGAYVPVTDPAFKAWGGTPTTIASEADLWDVVCPLTVTNYQARATMMVTPSKSGGGSLFDAVDAALKAQGGPALQAWEYANIVERKGQFVTGLATNFGLSDADIRNLFWSASQVS